MKLSFTSLSICFFLLLASQTNGLSQSLSVKHAETRNFKLKRVNPDGWFELFIPLMMSNAGRKADVDGGFFLSDIFEIGWDYWTYAGTPNFLRDSSGNYSKHLRLSCPKRPILRSRIGGNRAIIQKCFDKNALNGFRFTYYVTFPKLKVHDGQEIRYGVFNLSISYKNSRYLQTARQVVHSLNFKSQVYQLNKSQRSAFLQ